MSDAIYRRLEPNEPIIRQSITTRSALVWAWAMVLCALAVVLCARPERWESAELASAMSVICAVLSLLACVQGLRSTRVELEHDARRGTLRSRVSRGLRAHEQREDAIAIDQLAVREVAEEEAVLVDRDGRERSVRVPRAARAAMDELLARARGGEPPSAPSPFERVADGALVLCALAACAALCATWLRSAGAA